MWFKNAIGKEKIQFMFDNELHMQYVEIDSISLERFSDLKLKFLLKGMPLKHPEKWDKEEFNALNVEVTFGDLIQLNITGSRVGFFCSPVINSLSEYSEIKIEHKNLTLYCRAKFLTINSISPYIDERWGD
jgi:hypothetical protein